MHWHHGLPQWDFPEQSVQPYSDYRNILKHMVRKFANAHFHIIVLSRKRRSNERVQLRHVMSRRNLSNCARPKGTRIFLLQWWYVSHRDIRPFACVITGVARLQPIDPYISPQPFRLLQLRFAIHVQVLDQSVLQWFSICKVNLVAQQNK